MKMYIKTIDGLEIYFEALEECLSLSELFPENTQEQLEEIENNNAIFCAKVTAEKAGIELSSDYLGGCVYETEEDFYVKYKDCYFSDMVKTVLEEAKKELPKLIETLTGYHTETIENN